MPYSSNQRKYLNTIHNINNQLRQNEQAQFRRLHNISLKFSCSKMILDQFSINCCSTKRLVICSSLKHNISDVDRDQSEFPTSTCNRRQAREEQCGQVTIGFGFLVIG